MILLAYMKGIVIIMKRSFIAFISLFIYLLSAVPVLATTNTDTVTTNTWPDGPNVYAESAIVMEASTGLILYEKNIHEKRYPASITKIMTALLAIENSSLNDIVTFSKDAVFNVELSSSRIGIDVGEQLTMQQCLYGILLESANEVSYATAEHVAGSIPAFTEMMNEKAKSLGCLNTNFVNPHGLPDNNHVTTAYDMALITKAAMENETFRNITSTRTYKIPPTNIQKETRYLRNHHKFILKQDFFYDNTTGGKTGYTNAARYTLVTTAKKGDMELIVVIMKVDTSAHQYQDTQKLLDFGFDNFSVYPTSDFVNTYETQDLQLFTKFNPLLSKKDTPIKTDGNGYVILPNTASFEDAQKEVTFFDDKDTRESNVIGTISYTYLNKYVGGSNIIYQKDFNPDLVLDNTDFEYTQDTIDGTTNNLDNDKEIIDGATTPKPVDDEKASSQSGSLRPIIIGAIIGVFVIVIILYILIIERPRLKRRKAYYQRRANRRSYIDDDYMDL